MEIHLLADADGDVLARGAYLGGPDYEFFAASNGQVYFRIVGSTDAVWWAGSNAESFRRIVSAWTRYRDEVRQLEAEPLQLERVAQMRRELEHLGALPAILATNSNSLWSHLLFEAENGLG